LFHSSDAGIYGLYFQERKKSAAGSAAATTAALGDNALSLELISSFYCYG
jgi:hypothetical protein